MRTLDLWTVNLGGYEHVVAAAPGAPLDRIAATARLKIADEPRGYTPDQWADHVANLDVRGLKRTGTVTVDERDLAAVAS